MWYVIAAIGGVAVGIISLWLSVVTTKTYR